jgi:hypothetical protein
MTERVRTIQEYVDLVDQAIFDLEELLASAAYDIDDIADCPADLEVLLKEVRELRRSMADGSYLFGREDLHFMRLVKKNNEKTLPFIRLFYQINRTHKQGLDIPQG